MKQVNIKFPFRMLALVVGLFLSMGAFAQITVKGHVKDATGEGVIGATVRVAGTQNATITDFDGNFTLQAKQGADLQVSFMGYQTATVKAAPSVVVTLEEDQTVLNEVVVIGYGVAKKNDLTGSVTALKPDEKNRPLVTNAQEMMQGKIAGVNVTTGGGKPGEGASIRIRGGSSFSASNDPLIVIDGLAMDQNGMGDQGVSNPLALVNPNDIESFTVLKDASATAIYGSRGSNGVIIITTKKGRTNMAPQVSYNGNVSVSTISKYADVLNADEYRALVERLYGVNDTRYGMLGDANTDWQKEIYHTAVSTDHNLTVQGGLKNMPYRVSAGFTDQGGILKTSNYQRATASLNLSPTLLNDHLKFNINGKFMYAHNREANGGAIGNAISFDPTHPVTSTAPQYSQFHGYWQWVQDAPYNDGAWPYSKLALAPSNPVSQLMSANNRSNTFEYLGNVEVDYQIHGFEDLRIHMNFSGDYTTSTRKNNPASWSPDNFYYQFDEFNTQEKFNLNYTAYAQYYKDFAKTQHFDIMGGYEWRHEKYFGHYNQYWTYPETAGDNAGTLYQEEGTPWKSEHYLVSFYGRMNYIAFDRYMLTATLRADGSSRFNKDNRWGYFPSVALGWKINEESFLKNVDALDELKLRLGWGMTGQQEGIADFGYFASYNQPTSSQSLYPTFGDGYQYIPKGYNPNLKWETTTTYNIGLDFAFLKNRITGSVDVYKRKTTDMLMNAPVAGMSNFSNSVLTNIGSMENKGVEASLTVRPIQTENWQWEVTGNATYNKNEVLELAGDGEAIQFGDVGMGTGTVGMCHQVGQPMSSFWVWQQAYDENGNILQGVVVDRNADGQIDNADRYYYYSATAPWLFGLSSRLQYKNWDFGFGLRASYGNYLFNRNKLGYRSPEFIGSGTGYLTNTMPYSSEVNFRTSSADYDLTDYFVENASFIKCDNITLGYSFENLFKGGKYNGINGRIFATASNVFTITNYSGLDPEVGGGIDGGIYPRPISFVLGLSLNF